MVTSNATPHDHQDVNCAHCLVDPHRSRSSLIAWVVAALAVAFALMVWFARAGSFAAAAGGYGALGLLAILVCPLVMGGMMVFMMRK